MPGVDWGPSTVRAELALLEAEGYLTHPHTSAGRVPTDSGYRRYVDLLLESGQAPGDTQVELQLSRQPYPYPTLQIKRKPASIFDYRFEDFEVVDYQCHGAIKAPVAV